MPTEGPSPIVDSPAPASKSKIPKWVPVAMFAGTTVALIIPLLLIRRQRAQGLRDALSSQRTSLSTEPSHIRARERHEHDDYSSHRGTTAFAAVHFARGFLKSDKNPSSENKPLHLSRPPPPAASTSTSDTSQKSSEFSAPGPRELISAIAQVDYSTAVLAGKAFGIATCIVAVGGFLLTWSIKAVMGVENTREFAMRVRRAIRVYLPSLPLTIHRRTGNEAEETIINPPRLSSRGGIWDAEESERRLDAAYEQGGVSLWAQAAASEVEAELEYERKKRERESRQ